MSDENTDKPDKGEVEKTGEDNTEEQKNNASEGAGDDAGKEGKEDKQDKGGENKSQKDDDDNPPVKARKSVKDYIIERKQRKIEKLEKQKDKSGDDTEDDDAEEDNIDPADEEMIDKVVSKKFGPIMETTIKERLEAEDRAEAEEFVKTNPDFAPYRDKVLKRMNHPSRRQLPIESIFYEVAGKDILKIGAKRQKQAEEDAKRANTGGGTGGNEGEKSIWDLTPEEFAKRKEQALQRR